MKFRQFLAVYLAIVISASTVMTFLAPRSIVAPRPEPQNGNQVSSSNHFSVRWMGFSPTDYNNSYPEYTICINNLRDNPLRMQIAFQIKNQEAQGYYFLIDGYSAPAGWNFDPYEIGYITIDETKAFIYENVTRILPSAILQGRLTETITLVVKAYYNNTYTNLYSEDNVDVTFNFLDRLSSAWSVLTINDFNDNTTQDWSGISEGERQDWQYGWWGASVTASAEYYRSFQYSLRLDTAANGYTWTNPNYPYNSYSEWAWGRGGYAKTFQIPDVTEAYVLFSLRSDDYSVFAERGIMINGTTYFKTDATPQSGKWYQFAIPLQTNATNVMNVWLSYVWSGGGYTAHTYSYLDDVYVIAK
jgi:hypothetical protein